MQCKLCNFRSRNLVFHIENEHANLGLATYERQYGLDAMIHPDLQKQHLSKEEHPVSSITIAGVDLQKMSPENELKVHIPKVMAHYHFQAFTEDVIMDLQESPPKPVMLIGHTGTGKTSCFSQIAARIDQPMWRVNMNNQTTISDFVGNWTVSDGSTVWVDGALPWAMKEGLWLVIDELDFAEPAILSVLNAVLEPGGALVLKEKGNEVVLPHKNFRLCATANAVGRMAEYRHLYQGTNLMNEAFLDRWRCYVVDYLPEDVEAIVIEKSIEKMTTAVAQKMVRVAHTVRKAFAEETIQSTFSTRRLLDWGEMIVRHRKLKTQAPFKAAEASIFSKISREDRIAIEGYMQRILVGSTKEPGK